MKSEEPLDQDNDDELETDDGAVSGVLARRLEQLRDAKWLHAVLESAVAQMMTTGPRVTAHDIDYCKIKPNRDINVALRARLGSNGGAPHRLSATFYASPATCRMKHAEDSQHEPLPALRQQLLAAGFVRPV